MSDTDREWAGEQITRQWGARMIVSRGKVYYPHQLAGFVAFQGNDRVGLATYSIDAGECELVTIQSVREGEGVGSMLLDAVRSAAKAAGCRRLWLVTTNDNLDALGFYQKHGMSLVAVHRNAMDEVRRLKPMVPLVGKNGVPLRDEIELEMML